MENLQGDFWYMGVGEREVCGRRGAVQNRSLGKISGMSGSGRDLRKTVKEVFRVSKEKTSDTYCWNIREVDRGIFLEREDGDLGHGSLRSISKT